MNIVDLVILVALGAFVLAGFWLGLIHMLGAIVGLFVGIYLAGHYYGWLAGLAAPFLGGNLNLARLLAFIFIFVLVTRLFGLVLYLIDKVFKFVAIIPFLKTFNRLLGAVFGLLEGTLALGIALYFAGKFPVGAAFELLLRGSQLARPLNLIGALLSPLLPQAVTMLQSVL